MNLWPFDFIRWGRLLSLNPIWWTRTASFTSSKKSWCLNQTSRLSPLCNKESTESALYGASTSLYFHRDFLFIWSYSAFQLPRLVVLFFNILLTFLSWLFSNPPVMYLFPSGKHLYPPTGRLNVASTATFLLFVHWHLGPYFFLIHHDWPFVVVVAI